MLMCGAGGCRMLFIRQGKLRRKQRADDRHDQYKRNHRSHNTADSHKAGRQNQGEHRPLIPTKRGVRIRESTAPARYMTGILFCSRISVSTAL